MCFKNLLKTGDFELCTQVVTLQAQLGSNRKATEHGEHGIFSDAWDVFRNKHGGIMWGVPYMGVPKMDGL